MMQTAPAVGEATFQTFDAHGLCRRLSRRRALAARRHRPAARHPARRLARRSISGWSAWTVPRVGKASKDFSDARSAITGRIVDSYTNIQSVKLFAHTRTEEAYAGEAIETRARPSGADAHHHADGPRADGDQRLPDRRGDRLRAGALAAGRGDARHGGGGLGAGPAAERDDRLDHVVALLALPERRGDPRGDGDDHPADPAHRRAGRRARSRSSGARSSSTG